MLAEHKTKFEHYFHDKKYHKQGECKQWWSCGQLRTHAFYTDDMLHGEYKQWFSNGGIDIHCVYNNGKLHGEYKSLFPDGAIYSHCFYVNNIVISFDELPYPETPEDRMYFTLKYNIPLLVETIC